MFRHLLGLVPPQPAWFTHAPLPASSSPVTLTYLGTAGFVLSAPERTVVLDPFVTRHPLGHLLANKPLPSDPALVQRLIPKADDVLIGHAHFDHILDGPVLCQQTGARLVGSRAACMVGRAAGLPEAQLLETAGRENIASGAWTLRGLPSVHGKALFGKIPLPGDIAAPPPWPARMRDLRHGQVLNWLVDTGGLRVLHVDSADFISDELQGIKADLVCLCAIGRRYRPGYVREVVALTQPKWIVPCHWDTMVTPIDAPPEMLPGVDLPGFVREIEEAGVQALPVPMLGSLTLPRGPGAR